VGDPIDRYDEISEEAAILCGDGAPVTLEGELVLLLAADAPGLRHVFAVLAHAPARGPVFHLGNIEPDVGRPELA